MIAALLPSLVKVAATGLLVVSASAVAEALGPFWGALIASLPVSAGPAYVFLAMRQGPDFVAASALSSLAANASTGLLLIVYGTIGRVGPAWRGIATAVLAWLAASLAADQFGWTPASALLLNLAVYGTGFALLGTGRSASPQPATPLRRRWYDLPLRGMIVALFVSAVVAVSSLLGPRATGFAAVFPISLLSLIVIIRVRIGAVAATAFVANALRSMLGFGMALLTLHLAAQPLDSALALTLALLVSFGWSAALLLISRRPRPA